MAESETSAADIPLSESGRRGIEGLHARLRCRLIAFLLIGITPALMFVTAWRVGGVSALGDDLIYYLPARAYLGERLRGGELPLWNPYVAMGTPVAADPQAGLWYPFTVLFTFLPPLLAYCLTLWAHYALAGWGMYRFLRALQRHRVAALLGALGFEFSGYLIAHREHLTILETAAWTPWLFFAWERYARAPSSKVRTRYALLGCALWGLQLLVQHVQISIITAAVLGAYVVFVLRPLRRRILLAWPAAMAGGSALAAVQLMPTFAMFEASSRGTAAYYLFIENSWVLSSAMLLLFPMIYGNPTPNLWPEKWWGISHLIEQWCYPTILILVLAIASLRLLPRLRLQSDAERRRVNSWRHQVIFWWIACVAALLIALGDATPLAKALFHLPFYRSLRVPARWILVWSLAFPVLASLTLDAILCQGEAAQRVRHFLKRVALIVLPTLLMLAIVFMLTAPKLAANANQRFGSAYAAELLQGLGGAIRRPNPAILWPILLAVITAAIITYWLRRPGSWRVTLVFTAFLVDIGSVAPFVNSDPRTYSWREITAVQPLASAMRSAANGEAYRLLVPRVHASSARPLEVLWPQANVLSHAATLNGYGPLGDTAQRLLLRFMAWGAGDETLALLRNVPLLQRLGVGFLAVRLPEERQLLQQALLPATDRIAWRKLTDGIELKPVEWERGLLWAVHIDAPGLYELDLDAEPAIGSASRWFVRLESQDHQRELAATHTVEPVDLSVGTRRMRFLFYCDSAPGPAWVRVKSEMGQALRAGRARYALIASAKPGATSTPPGEPDSAIALRGGVDGIRLYAVSGVQKPVWMPESVQTVSTMKAALEWLLGEEGASSGGVAAVVERRGSGNPMPAIFREPGVLQFRRPRAEEIHVHAETDTARLVVLNETCRRGWRVDVDGSPADLERVNAICQGVWVPAGKHEVTFRYRQPGLLIGGVLSALALLGLTTIAIQTWRVGRA